MRARQVGLLVGLGLLASGAAGCRGRREVPDREAPAASAGALSTAGLASATTPASAAPSASAAAGEAVPTLGLERFAPGKSSPSSVVRIDGALLTIEGWKVGRVVGDTIEPVGKIPYNEAEPSPFGPPIIRKVHGRWPDQIDVIYTTSQPRAPMPSYMAIKGKGKAHTMGDGGAPGNIWDIATVGDTTLLAVENSQRAEYLSIAHGPKLDYKLRTPAQGGCKPGEVTKLQLFAQPPAVSPLVLFATPAGTLLSLGRLCGSRGTGAEVWGRDGVSRIVDLHEMLSSKDDWVLTAEPGVGDEVWMRTDHELLHYKDGSFEAVAGPHGAVQSLWRAPQGQLMASDREGIYRREGPSWVQVARMDWPVAYGTWDAGVVPDDQGGYLLGVKEAVYRLRERPGTTMTASCTTPLVHLYDVLPDNPANFTYPTTRKALAGFADVAGVQLVEFNAGGIRRLGAQVKSREQGEALIAYLATAMKDEHPRLLCHDPTSPRVIR